MADISDVDIAVIKDLYQRLETLSCRRLPPIAIIFTLLTTSSSYHDAGIVLNVRSPPTLDFNIWDLSPVSGRITMRFFGYSWRLVRRSILRESCTVAKEPFFFAPGVCLQKRWMTL